MVEMRANIKETVNEDQRMSPGNIFTRDIDAKVAAESARNRAGEL